MQRCNNLADCLTVDPTGPCGQPHGLVIYNLFWPCGFGRAQCTASPMLSFPFTFCSTLFHTGIYHEALRSCNVIMVPSLPDCLGTVFSRAVRSADDHSEHVPLMPLPCLLATSAFLCGVATTWEIVTPSIRQVLVVSLTAL